MRLGLGLSLTSSAGGGGPTIHLSSSTIADTAAVGDTVGALSVSGGTGSYTFTLTSNPGSLFSITGSALKVAAALTAGSDAITVQADNGVATPISRSFLITVMHDTSAPFAIVIEGDSITSGMPSTYSASYYSYRYSDSRPDLTINVRAQGSRSTGTTLNDDSNTLMGNVAEDMAYAPDLITALIGANDMALNTAATYKANLASWYAAVKAARPVCSVAWSAPFPYNPDQSNASYANFTAQRAIVMADARDPSVWGQWADYYMPLGEHPDWIANPPISPSLYGDGVHPTPFDAVNGTGGQNRIYDQYKAAVDTIADASRASATAPYESVWPASEVDLGHGTEIVRRFIVSGIAHTGLASGISVSGGDATVRLNGGAYGSSIGRIYNGDVIDLKLTTSAAGETAIGISLTIGSETRAITYTTGAVVEPVALSNAGTASSGPDATAINFPGVVFGNGVAVIALTCFSVSASSSVPPSLTLTPSGGGSPITASLVQSGGRAITRAFAVYAADVTADTYTITGTRPSSARASYLTSITVENGDVAQITAPAFTSISNENDPHLTGSAIVPVNAIALGWLMKENAVAGTANAPTTLISDGYVTGVGQSCGFVFGSRTDSGQLSFNNGFGTWSRGFIVIKALGS